MMDEKRPRATDEELLLLASGELPEARRAVLLSALEADPELARRLAVFRCLLEKPRHLPTERPSRRVLRALRHAARKEAAPVAGWDAWRRFFAWPRLTGAVAVAALFPALLVYTQRTAREPGGASPVADVAALEIEAGLDWVDDRLTFLDASPNAEESAFLWTADASELGARLETLQETLDDLSLELEWPASFIDRG